MKKFNLLPETTANFYKGKFSQYDMAKLEVEYDYETETEQIHQSQNMLQTDLKDAIDWFVADDPLKIVSNFDYCY